MEQVEGTGIQDFDPAFETVEPAHLASPLVFSSPHSGSTYPPRFLAASRLDPVTLRRSEDAFVDELVNVLQGNDPRYFKVVATPMVRSVITSVDLRPKISPKWPQIRPPIGRAMKPTEKVPIVAIVAAAGLILGKKALPNTSAAAVPYNA